MKSLSMQSAGWGRDVWCVYSKAGLVPVPSTVTSLTKEGHQAVLAGLSNTHKTKHCCSLLQPVHCINAEVPKSHEGGRTNWKVKLWRDLWSCWNSGKSMCKKCIESQKTRRINLHLKILPTLEITAVSSVKDTLGFWVFVKVLGGLPVHHHCLYSGKLYGPPCPAISGSYPHSFLWRTVL